MASRLYGYFLMCWKNGTVTESQLQTAVSKGYITQSEYEEITSTPQETATV
ncbi:XkdX family protein [Risungbinella massiliensis]|uniref:XkdX family protein n=1 Tax=Risungbinella massiliensis TaxID=1329796 RepID=UPI0009E63100|nr:XkdX family protein [Risungbinella massiliensis]